MIIELKDVNKTYPGAVPLHVLKGINLNIDRGELVSIMGASGSGKSTLLNIIGILDNYDSGQYILDGVEIKNLSENRAAELRNRMIGFVFQSFNLINYKNAVENVALPLTFQGVSKRERIKRAKKMVHMVGLDKYWDHKPNQMSGGQQQRVGVARALVVKPEIIFADEPTGNLDSNTSKEIMNLMQNVVREQKQTLIMVTHDNTLASFADKIIRIVDGKIVDMVDNTKNEAEE